MPLVMALLLVLLVMKVSFEPGRIELLDKAIAFSSKGPGAKHAHVLISLGAGLLVGFLAQRSRFCNVGWVRDAILIRDFHLLSGFAAMIVAAAAVNLSTGQFAGGFRLMPVSHCNHLWNLLGMVLAGLAFTLAGGCSGRQLFASGEGDTDAGIFVLGALVGAALAHNLFLAAVPDRAAGGVLLIGGPKLPGQIAVVVGLVFCILLGLTARKDRP